MRLDHANVLLTGASRGLGVTIACALARRGADLGLAARGAAELEAVAARVAGFGRRVEVVPTDVADPVALERLVERARAALGGVDVLVNNAGIEQVGFYEDLPVAEIDRYLAVNLRAPMVLTRRLLPDMLARNRGHIVDVASLAGLGPVAYGEPYGATKAGLIGFSRSLRGTLKDRRSAVSCSVVCPGFVRDAGMYAEHTRDYGVAAPMTMGTCTPAEVADAVVRAVEQDLPEVIVNGRPIRPILTVGTASPRLAEWLAKRLDAAKVFRKIAERRRAQASGRPPARQP
jgi:short-subunit dehydrogenase